MAGNNLVRVNEKDQRVAYAELYTWLRRKYPEQIAAIKFGDNITLGIVADVGAPPTAKEAPAWYERIANSVADLLPAYGAYQTQKQLIKLNIQRAQQGLSPIEANQLAPQVNVGVSSDIKTFAYIGLGAIALVILLPRLLKR